jgi:peptidoglycan/xylan/chitin deacetylase (PgdA/CDA1 family)
VGALAVASVGLAIVALIVRQPLIAPSAASERTSPEPIADSAGPVAPQAAMPTIEPTSPPAAPRIGTPRGSVTTVRAPVDWHIPVLMYHLISTASETPDAEPELLVAPSQFAAEMRTLRLAGWRSITASTLASDMEVHRRPPQRSFVITFDDGHVDGFTNAFPTLLANGFDATYFVITDRIGRAGYLSRSDLLEMAGAGMEIADHTADHLPLASLPRAAAFAEIDRARTFIASLLGSAPTTFAYPFGSVAPGVVTDVESDGFGVAFTNAEGCTESLANPFLIPRLRVGPGTTPTGLLLELSTCARG